MINEVEVDTGIRGLHTDAHLRLVADVSGSPTWGQPCEYGLGVG